MTEIRIESNGEQYSIDVEEPSAIEKMYFAARAPDELEELAKMDEGAINKAPVNSDVIDYLIYVTEETTEFEEHQLKQVPMETLLRLTLAVLEAALGERDDMNSDRCLKQVRATKEFIECLFTEKVAIVGGMPDDASLENFEYDTSRNELVFTFTSQEWETVNEGAEIPEHEAYAISLDD